MLLYIFHCLSEDLESQKRGIVMVSFPCINFDPSTISDPRAKRLISQILLATGVRISANHLCFPDKPWFRALGSLFMMASTQSVRVRTRLHYGKIFGRCARCIDQSKLFLGSYSFSDLSLLQILPPVLCRFYNRMPVQDNVVRNTK